MISGKPGHNDSRITIADGNVLLQTVMNTCYFAKSGKACNGSTCGKDQDSQCPNVNSGVTGSVRVVTGQADLKTKLGFP